MYKFTNGIIIFDKETRDKYLKAGYKLVENNIEAVDKNQITIEGTIEEKSENDKDNVLIEAKFRRNNKVSK